MGTGVNAPPVRWRVVGAGEPPVVLVHPLGLDPGFFARVTDALATRRACVLVELPGHGRCPVPAGGYALTEVAQVLDRVLDGAGLVPCDLVGCSMGAMVALAIAQRAPDHVGRLVLADTTARYAPPLRAMWDERAHAVRTGGMAAAVDALMPVWFDEAALADGVPAVRYVRGRLDAADPEVYALACEALRDADLREHLGDVRAPTLVVAGPDDVLAPDCEQLAAAIPDAQLRWLPTGRHGATLECAEAFRDLVVAFLAEPVTAR